MFKKFISIPLVVIICLGTLSAQQKRLSPGFDAYEYADLLWLAFYGISDSLKETKSFDLNAGRYERVMRSPEVGLYNVCEIYLRNDGTVILSLRGTVNKPESWMENFYAGMVPATGKIKLADDYIFSYQLATRTDALVHVGWTIGTGFLVREYLPVMDSLLKKGYRNLIVTGHSQGGALSFLNTSFLHYHYHHDYPDLVLKNYASAAPKPGNLYYAYDFEHITKNGYAYRVVNADDWVPESPISVQGLGDFNKLNPLSSAPETIKKQKFPEKVVISHMYNRMRKGSEKAAARYKKYLGNGVGKLVRKSLPGYEPPGYADGSNYMTAGAPIILMPSDAYRVKFPHDPDAVFLHHLYAPYFFLLKEQYKL
jgi:hypothetical protein